MTGTIFVEQFKQTWRQMLYWGVGLFMLAFYILAVIEDPDIIEQYSVLLQSFPPAMLSAFGLSDAALLTSAEGFVAFAGFTYGGLALAVFGVLAGLNITANDEDSGMMNVILALPTPRWQVIVERFLAYSVQLLVIVALLLLGIVVGANVFNVELDMMLMVLGSINLIPASLAIIGVTALIGGAFSNKTLVTSLAGGFVLVSYMLNIIAGAVNADDMPLAEWLGRVSVFTYLDSEGVILEESLNTGNVLILLVLAVVSVMIALYAFENRDIRG
ncbi:MAG: ABC transporter permease subunit [Anaerolineae bacterium]